MDASTLAKLYAIDGPFVTIYLATPSDTEDAAQQLDTRWRNVTRELANEGVDEATITALTSARGDHDRGGTRVLVAAPGPVRLGPALPQPTAQEAVAISELPRLGPLLDDLGL